MAILKSGTGTQIELLADHLIGRSSHAHTQLVDPQVSGQHASIRWSGNGWHVRDLGSRNGTWVDGNRVPPEKSVPLVQNSVIWFGGSDHAFTLTEATPPRPTATSGGTVIRGDERLLALPSEDEPKVVITSESEGWTLSTDDGSRTIEDGEQIELDGVSYVLSLPSAVARTVEATEPTGDEPSLQFRVSADEEYVEVTVGLGATSHPLPPRAHHYALLVLARARLEDAAQGVPEAEQGWIYTTSLGDQLRVTMNRLYVTLHRCRKELEAVCEGAGTTVIDKRVTTRQVRMGWSALEVGSL